MSPVTGARNYSKPSVWVSEITDLCCPGAAGNIGGAGFREIEADQQVLARSAWNFGQPISQGGLLKFTWNGEFHAYNPDVVTALQKAVQSGNQEDYAVFARLVNQRATGGAARPV